MQVIKNSKEFTPAEIYELTLAPNGEKMTNHVGETLEAETYCIYEDVDSEGEVRRVMAMKSDGKVFADSPKFFQNGVFLVASLAFTNASPICLCKFENPLTFLDCSRVLVAVSWKTGSNINRPPAFKIPVMPAIFLTYLI